MQYTEYLQTPHWQTVRQAAIARAGGKCQLCGGTTDLQVHHNGYDHIGAEDPTDTVVICDRCHARQHGKRETSADFWPAVRLEDGTVRRGPAAQIVGRWTP